MKNLSTKLAFLFGWILGHILVEAHHVFVDKHPFHIIGFILWFLFTCAIVFFCFADIGKLEKEISELKEKNV